MLLPALTKARDSANKIACASNLRQIGLATIMYAADNRDVLFSSGANSLGIYGFYTSDSMTAWLQRYFRVSDQYPAAGTPMQKVRMNVRFNTPRVLICPSAPEQPNYSRIGYGYFAGSHFPDTSDPTQVSATTGLYHPLIMKISKLNAAAFKGPRLSTGGQNFGPIGASPALWADRCNFINAGNNGGPGETGHWDKKYNRPAGGNVVSTDGSCRWMPFNTDNLAQDVFLVPTGALSGSQTFIPWNAIYVFSDNRDNATQTNLGCVMGRSYNSYKLIFSAN